MEYRIVDKAECLEVNHGHLYLKADSKCCGM